MLVCVINALVALLLPANLYLYKAGLKCWCFYIVVAEVVPADSKAEQDLCLFKLHKCCSRSGSCLKKLSLRDGLVPCVQFHKSCKHNNSKQVTSQNYIKFALFRLVAYTSFACTIWSYYYDCLWNYCFRQCSSEHPVGLINSFNDPESIVVNNNINNNKRVRH